VNIVIVNWQRPLWEGNQEVVKRSGRDEPMWVVIHKCMEAILGISLYSCFYLKLAKLLCISYDLLCFQQKRRRGQNLFRNGGGGIWGSWRSGEGASTMYTHVSKCKNDKIKEKQKHK
jgi:hypothetical protein